MDSEIATDQQNATNKRVRFDFSKIKTTVPKKKEQSLASPKASAISFVSGSVASLHHKLAPILLKLGTQHVTLLHELHHKKRQLTRITSDNDYIPSSARIVNFQFFVRKQVEDTAEFSSVKDETTAGIQEFRKFLKSKIVKVIELEISSLKASLAADFVIATHLIVRSFLLSTGTDTTIAHNVLEHIVTDIPLQLLKYSTMYPTKFNTWY